MFGNLEVNLMKTPSFLITIITILFSQSLYSQQIANRNSVIEKATQEISSANIESYIKDLVAIKTRHNLSSKSNPQYGIGAACKYIQNKLENLTQNGINKPEVILYNYKAGGAGSRLGKEVMLTNIVAEFKGNSNDNRVILLLAHYDSRSFDNNDSTIFAPGANDNGSGVSALLEISRVLSRVSTPVNIKVAFLSGEEHGLLGAANLASIAKAEGWNVIAVINNDMIGNSRSSETELASNLKVRVFSENIPSFETETMKRDRVFNSAENDSPSRQLARYIKEIGERYVDNLEVKLIYRNDRFGRGGDHTPFSKEGITAVRICEYFENYDRTHQRVEVVNGKQLGDLPDGVDIEYVRKNCALNMATILNLSLSPDRPLNALMDVGGLSSSTRISWSDPSIGKKPSFYYILIRETDQPLWWKKIAVRGNEVVIPYSKDNYVFGIQSVSEDGCESLPVMIYGKR